MKRNGFAIALSSIAIACAAASLADHAIAAGPKEKILYKFRGGDGSYPDAAMIADKAGNLYGTTNTGGTGPCSQNDIVGCGTIFELSPPTRKGGAWTQTVLYSFQGGNDGAFPNAGLIADKHGNLFGVTSQGGKADCSRIALTGCGVAFELSPSGGGQWTETRLYTFKGNPKGEGDRDFAAPTGVTFDGSGNLYGIAADGGRCYTNGETGTFCDGGAFELTRSRSGAWNEKILYRFEGRRTSNRPAGALLDNQGNLYGRIIDGGAFGYGGIFKLTPPASGDGTWTESSVYDFLGGTDGAFPLPGIVFDGNGNLYGVSIGTGFEYGNVYELTPDGSGGWTESVLYNFTSPANGVTPTVGPIVGSDGSVYGTTQQGGQNNDGVVFKLVPQDGGWTESVLYSFPGGHGGRAPYGGLVFGKHKALYGTTSYGGDMRCANGLLNGCGSVFEVAQ